MCGTPDTVSGFPADASATLMEAKGPDLRGAQQIHRLIVRREGEDLKSLFVSVFEAFSGSRNVTGVRVLVRDAETGSVAVRVELADGRRDTHLYSREAGRMELEGSRTGCRSRWRGDSESFGKGMAR